MTTQHDFGGVFGTALDTFFGLSQFHGHSSWLVCEVAFNPRIHMEVFFAANELGSVED